MIVKYGAGDLFNNKWVCGCGWYFTGKRLDSKTGESKPLSEEVMYKNINTSLQKLPFDSTIIFIDDASPIPLQLNKIAFPHDNWVVIFLDDNMGIPNKNNLLMRLCQELKARYLLRWDNDILIKDSLEELDTYFSDAVPVLSINCGYVAQLLSYFANKDKPAPGLVYTNQIGNVLAYPIDIVSIYGYEDVDAEYFHDLDYVARLPLNNQRSAIASMFQGSAVASGGSGLTRHENKKVCAMYLKRKWHPYLSVHYRKNGLPVLRWQLPVDKFTGILTWNKESILPRFYYSCPSIITGLVKEIMGRLV
jgi:hypothetical protein